MKQRLEALESQLCDVLISQEKTSSELDHLLEELDRLSAKVSEATDRAAAARRKQGL